MGHISPSSCWRRVIMWSALRVIASSARSIILSRLHIREDVECCSMVLTDFRSTLQTLARVKPDEVYNLAGPSSVALSFEQPVQAMESISLGTLHLLESIRCLERPIRFYNASSSECFGDTGPEGGSERTPFLSAQSLCSGQSCSPLDCQYLSGILRPMGCEWHSVQP